MDGPIPGQSLTTAPGSSPWEKPPRYADPAEAAESTWKSLTNPRQSAKVKALLESGIPAEVIAQQILHTGFTAGHWTPDVALLISKPVLGQVVAVGHAQGVKDLKIFKPDTDLRDFLANVEMTKLKRTTGAAMTSPEARMQQDQINAAMASAENLGSSATTQEPSPNTPPAAPDPNSRVGGILGSI
jgi:hypothetical protein